MKNSLSIQRKMTQDVTALHNTTTLPRQHEGPSNKTCIDNKGKKIPNGMLYAPTGPDVCQLCSCINGEPAYCWTVLCAPPSCHAIKVHDRCCEWLCIDETHGVRINNKGTRIPTSVNGGQGFGGAANGGNYINFNVNSIGAHSPGVDIGLRLVASSVTAILSLCLLFFLIYRLRRRRARRHRDQVAAMTAGEARDDDTDSVQPGLGDPEANGMPPRGHRFYWAWWKPTAFFEGRTAPPTYEDAVAFDGARSRIVRNLGPEREEDVGFSSDSGSDAPPYSEIDQDPVIIHPTINNLDVSNESQRSRSELNLPSSAALVLPCPAPPISQLHHVEHNAEREEDESEAVTEEMQASNEILSRDEVRETFTAEI